MKAKKKHIPAERTVHSTDCPDCGADSGGGRCDPCAVRRMREIMRENPDHFRYRGESGSYRP